jgi:hypothetical protein
VTVEISAVASVLVVIFPVARVKDERLDACREAAYSVLVEMAFVKILLVRRFVFTKEVKLPANELILVAERE